MQPNARIYPLPSSKNFTTLLQNHLYQTFGTLLVGIGFSQRESSVYLACLELGGAPTSQIALRAKLNRVTAYEVLKRLQRRGVVKRYMKGSIWHFMAVDPRLVIKQAKEHVARAEDHLPDLLNNLMQRVRKPKMSYFEGIDGIKAIYDDSLTAKTEILTFTNPNDTRRYLGEEFVENYVSERVRKRIPVRGFAPNDDIGQFEHNIGPSVLRQVRFFDREKYPLSNEIMIYDDKIAVFSGADEVGFILENSVLASTFRSIWSMVWDLAGERERAQAGTQE